MSAPCALHGKIGDLWGYYDFSMASSTASTATPIRHPFDRQVEEVKPSKMNINAVIMDYLLKEGYPNAAKKFASEANIEPTEDLQFVQERVSIRDAIHEGDIQTAIERINELNYEILDTNPTLHFALLRLHLIELIRVCTSSPNGDIGPALSFATTQLAPRAPANPEFLEELERTMALLIFPLDNLAPPLAALLDPSLRKQVALKVNEAILVSQGERREAKIRFLVRLRTWSEKMARESHKNLPAKLPLGLDVDGEENGGAQDTLMQEAELDDNESL